VKPSPAPGSRQRRLDAEPARCCHADDPALRPHCTLTPVVQFGNLMLCSACNDSRSSIGKSQHAVGLPLSPALDVLAWISTAQHQAVAADRTLNAAVTRARQAGHPWSAIGCRLGVTRQAAQQRFGTQPDPARRPRAALG
jgi:hypothetical protein